LETSCIALAGGKSNRLGRNKLFEVIGGKTLFARVISILALFNSEIIVVTSEQSQIPSDISNAKIKIVNDIFPDKGSLGGIYSGLVASKTLNNIVVACDMPFLNYNLLKYFAAIADGFDLVAFHNLHKYEPLHAVYSRKCISPMENLLQHKNNERIIEILPQIVVRNVSQEEIERIDPYHLSFFNINTEAELETARSIAREDLNHPRLPLLVTPDI
jgi:molybdopterin-guanine dinucleotide biosynthesis protein A